MVELESQNRCPACGSKLSRERVTSGLCPGCLIDLALESPAPIHLLETPEDSETLAYRPDGLAEGQTLGDRYRIRSLLGRGGMGEVWRAVDLKLRVEVALKALRAELLRDERALESLRQEVRMAREVISPNVCRVFDLVELDGMELVSMEYIDGITLLDILKMRAPLDLSEAREIAAQFLAGLEAIHEANLVHRDVKPENIMMTRSGRVVLMDFGIAKGLAEGKTGTVSGTPAYMAPEQARGEASNARVDVFSAGVVLAEMVAPNGLGNFEARQAIWQGVQNEPPEVPESPWAPVLKKAVARISGQRYPSASALARALEEVTLRVDRAEDVKPYPGLSSFSQEDSKYFFGRELEVEEMWKKLRRPQLLGLIGPSGAGKSSFLRAGLLAVLPTGWRAVVTAPGNQPFATLARALVPEVSGDTEALQLLVNADDSESLVEVVRGWRQQHDQVLLVLDQFEELFTQNSTEVQERFAELLARLALEADAHVLISMRDDFLFYCSSQPALSPMFSELTPLRPPSGTALRRALVQPALKCGYRFEDEALVGEMVAEVSAERGALPMLAFTAARLWEYRDRKEGLLTREAYEHIGGVGGALALHAEQTLETIGQDNIPIVRELFRNLVTAQSTRVARTRDELLSVFAQSEAADEASVFLSAARYLAGDSKPEASERPDQITESSTEAAAAASVLDALIDARLLTSFEVPTEDDEGSPQQRIEIIHESLLANWPRLVRWQTQDVDSAQLRDQLRQAAQMWKERGRPDDLLWTGTSYNEYQLWRERNRGGLSSAEEIFAEAMTTRAQRHRKRRKMAVAAALTLAIGVAVVTGSLWRQSEISRQKAEVAEKEARSQAARAEANQLLALGRLEIERHSTGALAYALASLERADTPDARLFALEILWRGPVGQILEDTWKTRGMSVDFSPDGKWLAACLADGSLKLWASTGGPPKTLDRQEDNPPVFARFGSGADLLVSRNRSRHEIQIRSIPDGRLVRTLPIQARVDFRLAGKPERLFTTTRIGSSTRIEAWPLHEGRSEPHADLDGGLDERANVAWPAEGWPTPLDVDRAGTRVAYVNAKDDGSTHEVYVLATEPTVGSGPRLVGRHPGSVGAIAFDTSGKRLASADDAGEVRIWDLESGSRSPSRVLRHPAGYVGKLRFDQSGSWLAATSCSGHAALWDLEGLPDPEPIILRRDDIQCVTSAAFHPQRGWLATASYLGVTLWPIGRRYPQELHGHKKTVTFVRFLPDGKSVASISEDRTLRLSPLAASGGSNRVLFTSDKERLRVFAADPSSRQLLVGGEEGSVWLVSLDGESSRRLGGLDRRVWHVALGEHTAAASAAGERENPDGDVIRVWELETGEHRDLTTETEILQMVLTPDEHLIIASANGIRIWDPIDGTFETLSDRSGLIDLSRDGRSLLAGAQGENDEAVLYDLETGASIQLDSHGTSFGARLDAGGKIALTKSVQGQLRVGPVGGAAPHMLVSQDLMTSMDLSPDGRWIAGLASRGSNTIRLWPVPDLTQPPLHTLPHDELLAKLRTLTNLRVVRDPESETGWGWALDPFPGWEEVPTW